MSREWESISKRCGPLGTGFAELDNLSHVDQQVMRMRPGFTPINSSGMYFRRMTPFNGKLFAVSTVDNKIYTVDPSTGATVVNVTISSADWGQFARNAGRLYWSSPTSDAQAWDDSIVVGRTVGIVAPAVAPTSTLVVAGSGLTLGAHLFRYRYYDSVRNRYSNPSAAVSVTLRQAKVTAVVELSATPPLNQLAGGVISDTGDGYATAPAVTVRVAAGGTQPTATSSLVGGQVSAVTVGTAGTFKGYASLYIAPPSTGVSLHVTASADTTVDKIIVEATTAGGTQFYQYATVSNTTADITISGTDAILAAKNPVALYGDDGHNPMPRFDYLVEHRGRLFGFQKSTKLLAWSRPGYPESWDITKYARSMPQVDTADPVTGIVSFLGDLYVFTNRAMWRYSFVDDPSNGTFLPIPSHDGIYGPDALIQVDDAMFGLGPNGVWAITAVMPKHISMEADPFLEAEMATALASRNVVGWYNRRDRSVTWSFVNQSGNTRGISLNLRNMAWTTRTYPHLIQTACSAYDETYMAAQIPGVAGAVLHELPGYKDGVASAWVSTVQSTSLGYRITPVTMPPDMNVFTQVRINGVNMVVIGVGVGYFDVSSTTGITAGMEIIYGGIPFTFETEWWFPAPVERRQQCAYLGLELDTTGSLANAPTPVATFQMAINQSATPLNYVATRGCTPPDGVTLPATASPYVSCNLRGGTADDGFVAIPLQSNQFRSVQFRVTGHYPQDSFGIVDILLLDKDKARMLPAVGE